MARCRYRRVAAGRWREPPVRVHVTRCGSDTGRGRYPSPAARSGSNRWGARHHRTDWCACRHRSPVRDDRCHVRRTPSPSTARTSPAAPAPGGCSCGRLCGYRAGHRSRRVLSAATRRGSPAPSKPRQAEAASRAGAPGPRSCRHRSRPFPSVRRRSPSARPCAPPPRVHANPVRESRLRPPPARHLRDLHAIARRQATHPPRGRRIVRQGRRVLSSRRAPAPQGSGRALRQFRSRRRDAAHVQTRPTD